MPIRLLLVEDDAIAGTLRLALDREGYEVAHVGGGEAALARHAEGDIDVIVLDLGLPDMDGLEVCRRIREVDEQVVMIIVSARGQELDRVVGLDAGADDYLVKPFALAELAARLRAILRRARAHDVSSPMANGRAEGALAIDERARKVFIGSTELHLTAKEFDLLALLGAEQGKVITREALMDEVWDANWFGSTKTLDVTVSRLRRKLEAGMSPVTIQTVRGVGFRLES